MSYITVNCRKLDRPSYQNRDAAINDTYHMLRSMPVGTVAAVWEGDTQVYAFAVKRLRKQPVIVGWEKWPQPGNLAIYGCQWMPQKEQAAIRKAAEKSIYLG